MKRFFSGIFLQLFLILPGSYPLFAQSAGGTISGGTSICPNSPNAGFLMLSGYSGTILYWESTTDGGLTWTNIGNPINSYSYSNLKKNTCYRVIVQNGTLPPDTSTVACINIIPPSVGGTVSGSGTFCGAAVSDTLRLTGNVGNVLYWQESVNKGSSWTTVPDTTAILVHPTLTQNTLYRAVVRNGATCPADTSSKASLSIDPVTVKGTLAGGNTVCYGSNAGTMSLSGYTGKIISWLSSSDSGKTWINLPDTAANHNYQGLIQNTWLAVVVKSGICSADTAAAAIQVRPSVKVDAGHDTTVTKGKSMTLHGSGKGSAKWSPSAGLNSDTVLAPVATPEVTTLYVLTLTDSFGCVNRDSVLITVTAGEFEGAISNLFTPNGDGVNDSWYIKGIESFPDNEVSVFNIYGNKVYSAKGYGNDWKGTYNGMDLPDGTYYYVLKLGNSSEAFRGSVDILRNK